MRLRKLIGPMVALGIVAELILLYVIGSEIGAVATVIWLLSAAVLGSWLARHQGAAAWRELRAAIQGGDFPARHALGAVLALLGGVLLIVPGALSDVIGLILLIPPTRRWISGRATKRWDRRFPVNQPAGPIRVESQRTAPEPASTKVIEGEVDF